MESLDIRHCFDYVECIQENKLDKIALARKIIDKFGATAAIVGDRSHDIEAARANDSLSIGALYGYGESEPEQADITINSFDRLLSIFDRRRPVFEKMLTEIEGKRGAGRPFVVGINGIDCSGKTLFAGAFEEYLVEKGCHTQLISLDDFLNPAQIRYAGNNRDELYYERVKQGYTFNFTWLVKTLLKPAREKGELTASLVSKTGIYDMVKEFNFTPDTIIILEGVFLFIDELAPYIDYKIYLDVPFETCRERARARDPEEVFNKYEKKYLPAQQKYLDEFPPDKTADMVIDNSNWEYPQIRFIK
jgi:uridine kinase